VVRNDEITADQANFMRPQAIVISPGPGRPEDAGECVKIIRKLGSRCPILGVCLGHQAICQAMGGEVVHARRLMHGKQSRIRIVGKDPMFEGLPEEIEVARYHSLAADPDTLPECLEVTAVSDEGEIMAVKHRIYPIHGVQFHPESILTPQGRTMMEGFLRTAGIRIEGDE
ncbi:MAG: aminodeoxychorismate/anthranilate synthase component II, partial [Candidatus Methanomethylophilaceae archaeon]|nr:aminodeoxychorismate/anthranilate synthase component II [Candidatus Methanomethylophilaceae archaeon]